MWSSLSHKKITSRSIRRTSDSCEKVLLMCELSFYIHTCPICESTVVLLTGESTLPLKLLGYRPNTCKTVYVYIDKQH